MFRSITLAAVIALILFGSQGISNDAGALQRPCTRTLTPAANIGDAIARSEPNDVICLTSGVFPPIVLNNDAPRGISVRGLGDGVTILGSRATPAVSIEADAFLLSDVTVRGGGAITIRASGSRSLVLRSVRVMNATLGIVLDDETTATLDEVAIENPVDVGLVVTGRSRVAATRLSVVGGGIGVAVLTEDSTLTLRQSRLEASHGPAVLAGMPGCADLPSGTAEVPRCFLDDPSSFISNVRVTLEEVAVKGGPGAGVVLLPGVHADIRKSEIAGRGRGGILAWGADATVLDSVIEDNREYGIAIQAYPTVGRTGFPIASATIRRATVRWTQAVDGLVGGNGVVARGASVSVRDSTVIWNDGAGIRMTEGSVGELLNNHAIENRGDGICLSDDTGVVEQLNDLTGNREDGVVPCR